jgi:hypothetical protein
MGLVANDLGNGANCLIVNNLEKHEADERGFRPVIADAPASGLPVPVGLNALNRKAFLAFVC